MKLSAKIKGFEDLQKNLDRYAKQLRNPIRFFARAKIIMFQDVLNHFQKQEGTRGRWKSLKKSTLLQRRMQGRGAKILRSKGELMNSITAISTSKKAEVGTNKKYARIHNEGGVIPPRFVRPRRKKVLSWLSIGGQRRFSKGHSIPATVIPERRFAWLSKRAGDRITNQFILDLKGAI